MDGVVTHAAGEHGDVLGCDVGGTKDALFDIDVGRDICDLLRRVAELAQRTRNGLVDDAHVAATNELLHLDQTKVGLDAGGVAIHHQANGARRCQHTGLAVAHAVLFAVAHCVFPRMLAGGNKLRWNSVDSFDFVAGITVHAQHVEHVHFVLAESGERTHAAGGAGADGVGMAGHQRGERGCPGTTLW